MTTILAVAGSLRRDSFNRRLLLAAGDGAPAGVRLTLWEDLAGVPGFDQDAESGPTPPAVADLREQIRTADAVLIATPEYNGSNALRDKPVAVIGAGPGPRGAQRAQEDLRRVLGVIGADVVEVELAVASVHRRFDQHGNLIDDTLRHQLRQVLGRLGEHADPLTVRLAG